MIKYSDNPDLGGKIVESISGKMEYRNNCRKMKGAYYIKGEDCHWIDNTWYRVNSGMIVFNYTSKSWVLKSKAKELNLIEGIVADDGKCNFIMGFFEANPCMNVKLTDARKGSIYTAMSVEILSNSCIEYLSLGEYYFNLDLSGKTEAKKIKNLVNNKDKGYNIEDNEEEFADKIKWFEKNKLHIDRNVLKYSKLLGDITFGCELECIRGYLPSHIQYQTGTVVCRDGSLHDQDGTQGPEFTTIPMTGAKGVQALINLCNGLTERTDIDKHCAMHLHIGNIPTSRLFLVALYKLGIMIQDELFALFPYYKNDERQYAGKDKNYCQKLTVLQPYAARCLEKDTYNGYVNDGYYRIFNFLSGTKNYPSSRMNRSNKAHPKVNKWERFSRYYWLNLMNTIFSKRNTVEFRLHNGTTNAQKTITWLFICNAIVKTATLKAGQILTGKKFTLNDVIEYYLSTKVRTGNEMYEYLSAFIAKRKDYFEKDYKRGDVMSLNELIEDKTFHYDINEVSQMF